MRNPELEIAILCGGRGTRMGEPTDNRQKCMLEVEGKPILAHVLDQMADAFGKARVFFLTGYRSEDVFNYFNLRYRNLDLEYLPVGGAIGNRLTLLAAENAIKGKAFLFSAGDVIAKANELSSLVQTEPDNLLGAILLATKHEVAPTHSFAQVKNSRIIKIEYPPTKPAPSAGEYRTMDIGFYSKRLFQYLKMYEVETFSEVLKNIVELGEIVEGKIYKDTWFHFATPQDLLISIHF